MPRRRPSYGSHGVVENNKRVGPPESSPTTNITSNITERTSLVSGSRSNSNVEQWLTSSTIPISENAKQNQSRPTMTRGQRFLRSRMGSLERATANATSTTSSKPPQKPVRRRSHQLAEEETPTTQITLQRNGKRFIFDSVADGGEDHNEDANFANVVGRRPGMPSPMPPPPPPPANVAAAPRSPTARRPAHGTPASSTPQPQSQQTTNAPKQSTNKPKKKIPFVKRHDAAIDRNETIERLVASSSNRRRPPKPEATPVRKPQTELEKRTLLQRLASLQGSNGVPTQHQQAAPASDAVSTASSVTEFHLGEGILIQKKSHTPPRNMIASQDKEDSDPKRDFFWNSDTSMKSSGKGTSIQGAHSPNSCSITAATSGSRSEDDVSQLTDPSPAHRSQGITSHADTEKIKNLSKQPQQPPKASSKNILDEEASPRVDDTAREKPPPFRDDSSANRSFSARINPKLQLRKTNRIKLHVYDLVENDTQLDLFGCYFPLGQCFNALNSSLHSMGTGAYHVGVEINGIEYAYGANSTNGLTGVFTCMPKTSPGYQYRQTIDFGNRLITRNDKAVVKHKFASSSKQSSSKGVPVDGREIIRSMAYEYMGTQYDLLRKNCCTFAYDACLRLGVTQEEIPSWFHNLAAAGAVTQDAANSTLAPITQAFKEYVHENGGLEEGGYDAIEAEQDAVFQSEQRHSQ